MKSKLLLPKHATYLIGAGVILMMLGYALSGFSTDRYHMYQDERHWYNVVGFYIDD